MTSSNALRPRVAVVGSVNVDLVVHVDRHIRPGETLLASMYEEVIGGKGLNQAVAAARDGEAHLIGAVGNDRFGAAALEHAEHLGVLTAEVTRTEGPTGRAFINVSPDGENSIVVAPLANRELTSEQVMTALGRVRPTAVLAQLETPLDTVLAAARWCRDHGVRFMLNPSPVAPIPNHLIGAADPLIVNESEAEAALGQLRPGHHVDTTDHQEVADVLADSARSVVITVGAGGAVFSTPSARGHVAATPVEAVDTAGAGDEFAGTLMVGIARGDSMKSAVRRSNAAAAALVSRSRSDRADSAIKYSFGPDELAGRIRD